MKNDQQSIHTIFWVITVFTGNRSVLIRQGGVAANQVGILYKVSHVPFPVLLHFSTKLLRPELLLSDID